jgi:alkanesulfonate monooxygenase SsuD/methylene tetrahydromethanopterin reductase-like flavin-dependent oxidoreductase (luciferase family)
MKFGFTIPYSISLHITEIAQIAETAGWDGLFLGDAIWCADPMILLTAAACATTRLRLGTLVTPMPLRSPLKLASECIALDHISNGRLTLGLGAGAAWMGWQIAPDTPTDLPSRVAMLDEGIDLLTGLFRGEPFDFDGQYFHLKLSQLDPAHYPPRLVQQPRVPLWVVGVWPRQRSMKRALKGDGVIAARLDEQGKMADLRPEDVRAIHDYAQINRPASPTGAPFDIIVEGQTHSLSADQAIEKVAPWAEAGATWWIDSLWGLSDDAILDHLHQGPPRL